MVKSTPLIKPEPRDFGIPPPQGPSSSDPSSMVPRVNPSLASVQHRSRQEPSHVQQGPRERDQSTSNALGWYCCTNSIAFRYRRPHYSHCRESGTNGSPVSFPPKFDKGSSPNQDSRSSTPLPRRYVISLVPSIPFTGSSIIATAKRTGTEEDDDGKILDSPS